MIQTVRDWMMEISMQICDDTNQAKGFAVVGTSGGIARLLVR